MFLDFATLTIGSIARKSTKDKEDQQGAKAELLPPPEVEMDGA